jgi:hypothetical protein
MVPPGRGSIFLGRRQQREDQVFHVISQLDHRYASEVEDHHLSGRKRPVHHPEDRALTAAFPPPERASASYSRSRRWATASRPSSCDTSGALHLTCQKTYSTPSGPAGYPPTCRSFSPVSRSAAWTPQRAVRTVSRRWHLSRRSLALVHPPKTPHFFRRSRTSPARWRHSAPSRAASAPASETLPLAPGTFVPAPDILAPVPGISDQTADPPSKAIPHPPSAGTIVASGPERKSVPRPAPTASKGNQRSRHHRRHVSALWQAAS